MDLLLLEASTKLPPTFELPSRSALMAWQYYWLGNKQQNIPPLRFVNPHDMPTVNMRKRLSDCFYLMHAIEAKVKESGRWVDETPTPKQVNEMFEHGGKWKVG